MKDDLQFMQLWDTYAPLLTQTQREITDLYFNYDLSLAEIAEQKGVSRQSVSDCLGKCRKQLELYEQKLGFMKEMTNLSREYSAYMTQVNRFIQAEKQNYPALCRLETELREVHNAFGAEQIALDGANEIVGKVFRED